MKTYKLEKGELKSISEKELTCYFDKNRDISVKEEIQRLKLSDHYFKHSFATLGEIEKERERRVELFIKKHNKIGKDL